MNPAMWISKTGVQAQDAKLQAIANNLANVNTMKQGQGIMVRGERTLAFGFMPQLVEDTTQDAWKKLFVREITKVASQRSRPQN